MFLRKGVISVALFFLLASCSSDGLDTEQGFQANDPAGFVLTDVFDEHGTLEDAWNCLDPKIVNEQLEGIVNPHKDDFSTFSYCFSDLMGDDNQVMLKLLGTDLKSTLGVLLNSDDSHHRQTHSFYQKSGAVYTDDFFMFLDALSEVDPEMGEGNGLVIIEKILSRFLETNTPQEIRKDMQDMMDDINDPEYQDDFIDVSKALGRLFIQSDTPMWVNKVTGDPVKDLTTLDPEKHNNMDIGNAVEGQQLLMLWLNKMVKEPDTRETLHTIVKELANVFEPYQAKPDQEGDNGSKLRPLIYTLEDHFTEGGEIYDNDPHYHIDNEEIYVNAELGETIKDIFPFLMQLFVRSDKPNSILSDKNNEKFYPMQRMMVNLKTIQWDPDTANIEKSIYNMLRHDILGRDRVTDPEANHISHLEHLLAFAAVSANSGYTDGGITGEISDSAHPNFNHGHGDFCGKNTLNDVIYAIKTSKTLNLLSMYDLSLQKEDKDHIYRSFKPFTIENKDNHKFNYDQNMAIGNFFNGLVGILGSPKGGSNPKDEDGEPIKNAYKPYFPVGLEEDNVGTVISSGALMASWTGVGPFYYAPENPPTVSFYDKTWEVYYNNYGEIYAYVHKPDQNPGNWEYIYPQNGDQKLDHRVYYFGKLRQPLTHSLFISSVDLTDGIPICNFTQQVRIRMGDPNDPDIDVVATFLPNFVPGMCEKYYQKDVIRIINNAVGRTVCFPYNTGGKAYVQIVSDYGPITLTNKSHIPIDQFFVSGIKTHESVAVEVNAFLVENDAHVNFQIDDDPEKIITFSDPNLKIWSLAKIKDTLLESDIAEYVLPYRTGFVIIGKSDDPEVAKLVITNTPGSLENGVEAFFGGNGDSIIRQLERWLRYKSAYLTDYYMTRLNIAGRNYYSAIKYDQNGDMNIVDIEDGRAQPFLIEELMDETDPRRACATPEEALFKNYQWFYADKKFVLPTPLRLSLLGNDIGMIFLVMEANGFSGFMNARKFRGNHVWAKYATNGVSEVPGDFRFEVVGITILDYLAENNLPDWLGDLTQDFLQKVLPAVIYDETMGCGAAFTGVMATMSPGIYRLAFPVAPKMHHGYDTNGEAIVDHLVGAHEFQVGDELWENRNALLPVMSALFDVLDQHTELGYEGEGIKSGIRQVIDVAPMLLKPLIYYQKDKGAYPHKNFKIRLVDDHDPLKSTAELYSDAHPMETWYGSDYERKYYLPAMKKTVVNMLIDSDMTDPQKRCDGLLAEIKDSKVLTNTLKLFMNDANDSVAFCRAFEQISSTVKLTKGEYTKINEGDKGEYSYGNYKQLKFPDWMFVKGKASSWDENYGKYTDFQTLQGNEIRDGDLVLDDSLDSIIGHDYAGPDHEGYGLAEFPDDKSLSIEEDWEDFNKSLDILAVLFHEDSIYSITNDLLGLSDSMLGKNRLYTPDEISGLLYGIGKLFAHYDESQDRWIYQGYDKATHQADFNGLYNIFKLRLPRIHNIIKDDTGRNYYAILKTQAMLYNDDGLMEYMIDTVIETDCVPYSWSHVIMDLYHFLGDDIVKESESPLWSTLTDLLNDMGKAISDSENGAGLDVVYENYGFQKN